MNEFWILGMPFVCLLCAFGMPLGCLCACYHNELLQIVMYLLLFSNWHHKAEWNPLIYWIFYHNCFIHWCFLFSRSQMVSISSHRKYNPFKSRVIMALYALFSCIIRTTGLVIYVVLTLGLLDVLRHLQGSQDTISKE